MYSLPFLFLLWIVVWLIHSHFYLDPNILIMLLLFFAWGSFIYLGEVFLRPKLNEWSNKVEWVQEVLNCGVLNAYCYENPEFVDDKAALPNRKGADLRTRIPNMVLEANHLGYLGWVIHPLWSSLVKWEFWSLDPKIHTTSMLKGWRLSHCSLDIVKLFSVPFLTLHPFLIFIYRAWGKTGCSKGNFHRGSKA